MVVTILVEERWRNSLLDPDRAQEITLSAPFHELGVVQPFLKVAKCQNVDHQVHGSADSERQGHALQPGRVHHFHVLHYFFQLLLSVLTINFVVMTWVTGQLSVDGERQQFVMVDHSNVVNTRLYKKGRYSVGDKPEGKSLSYCHTLHLNSGTFNTPMMKENTLLWSILVTLSKSGYITKDDIL